VHFGRRGRLHARLMVDFLIVIVALLIRHVLVVSARCSIKLAMSSPGVLKLLS
jgi:hypothetical protein